MTKMLSGVVAPPCHLHSISIDFQAKDDSSDVREVAGGAKWCSRQTLWKWLAACQLMIAVHPMSWIWFFQVCFPQSEQLVVVQLFCHIYCLIVAALLEPELATQCVVLIVVWAFMEGFF